MNENQIKYVLSERIQKWASDGHPFHLKSQIKMLEKSNCDPPTVAEFLDIQHTDSVC